MNVQHAMTIAESLARAKAHGERGSVQAMLDNPRLMDIMVERIENLEHQETVRELVVEACRAACKPLISDADYRQVGRIAERLVKDAAVAVCNDYAEGL